MAGRIDPTGSATRRKNDGLLPPKWNNSNYSCVIMSVGPRTSDIYLLILLTAIRKFGDVSVILRNEGSA